MSIRTVTNFVAAIAAFAVLESVASAAPITAILNVNVYDVCDTGHVNCTSTGPSGDAYYAAEVNAIWAQAGIQVNFNNAGYIDSTLFNSIDDTAGSGHTFNDLDAIIGGPSLTTANLFLVHSIDGGSAYGEGYVGFGGAVIGMDLVNSFNSGAGRLDTVAHELGHNLGLVPNSSPESNGAFHSTDPTNLMADGGIRLTPSTIGDIAPNGAGYDLLPADQIATALNSQLLQDVPAPEPSSIALAGFALLALGVLRRRLE